MWVLGIWICHAWQQEAPAQLIANALLLQVPHADLAHGQQQPHDGQGLQQQQQLLLAAALPLQLQGLMMSRQTWEVLGHCFWGGV